MNAVTNVHPQTHWLRSLPEDEQRAAIVRALERTGGHCTKAAQVLDMSRMILWKRLGELGMLSMPAQVRERAKNRFRLVG